MPVSESFPVRGSMLAVGCLTAVLLLAALVPDKGEVVRLITLDAEGRVHETDLWIVDIDDQMYLRAGSRRVGWLARLQSDATATLERSNRRFEIETSVEDDAETRTRLDRAMAQKYGMADRAWSLVRSPIPVAIRVRVLGAGTQISSPGLHGYESAPTNLP